MTLEQMIENFESALLTEEKKAGQNTFGKDEFLSLMCISQTRRLLGIPMEFVQWWAGKQDWPMTYQDASRVNVAWWKQLIAWRDGK